MSDMKKILISALLENAYKNGKGSPRRTTRNLIDMGVNFAKGRFQKRFLGYAQEMLQNPDSAYYELVTDTISHVDKDVLFHFCMNLGYQGCTKGAEQIRTKEVEKGFHIPWSLTFYMNQERMYNYIQTYKNVIKDGVGLGIYAYIFFLEQGNPEKLLEIFRENPECAFLLMLRESPLEEGFLEKVKELGNIMISVRADTKAGENCKKMRKMGLMYAIHTRYGEDNIEKVLSEMWLQEQLAHHPQFIFLISDSSNEKELRKMVYEHVLTVRTEQKHPVFYMDLKQDLEVIDSIISENPCIAGFDEMGNALAHLNRANGMAGNIDKEDLETILKHI